MKDYKSKINSYSTANGDKWRIEYAYKTPDGKYHRSCKRGFDFVFRYLGDIVPRMRISGRGQL